MMAGTLHRVSTLFTQVGLPPHADGGGEGRLGARVGAAAFEGVDQCGFFTADVATGAGVHEQLEIEAGAEDVLAQQAGGLGFFDGAVEALGGWWGIGHAGDVAAVGLERAGTDQHAFHQQMGSCSISMRSFQVFGSISSALHSR